MSRNSEIKPYQTNNIVSYKMQLIDDMEVSIILKESTSKEI